MKSLSLSITVFAYLVSVGFAANRPRVQNQLDGSVRQVLNNERDGKTNNRRTALMRLTPRDSQHAVTDKLRWQSGYICSDAEWNKDEWIDVTQPISVSFKLNEYRRRRTMVRDEIDEFIRLANWCRDNELPDQERAHLRVVLEKEPHHKVAGERVGFKIINGMGYDQWEIAVLRDDAVRADEALRHWTPKLLKIRARMLSPRRNTKNAARKQLYAISDPSAVPAIESVFSSFNSELAEDAIEAISGMKSEIATAGLARQTIFPEWKSVRQLAVRYLKSRNPDHYVPTMLSNLFTKIDAKAFWAEAPKGPYIYKHTFLREGYDRKQSVTFENSTLLSHPLGIAPHTPDELLRASRELKEFDDRRREAREVMRKHEEQLKQQNAMTAKLNSRIYAVIGNLAEEKIEQTPQAHWQWWSRYTDTPINDDKTVVEVHENDRKIVEVFRYSCLAAGTPVWTETGLVAIDKIQVGDRVLSKNVETGQLAFKPVLATTVRPPVRFFKLNLGEETIQTTAGHQYWVSGHGWTRANRLRDGMLLNYVVGTTPVQRDGRGLTGKAYNLVVADFHTYFVGKSKVLSHDVRQAEPTDVLVPGLQSK